jgi:hypothetical protein
MPYWALQMELVLCGMLIDHKAELQYRTVERVLVFSKDDLDLANPESRSFALRLSPSRSPPKSSNSSQKSLQKSSAQSFQKNSEEF